MGVFEPFHLFAPGFFGVVCYSLGIESKKSVRDLHTGLNVIVILYPTSICHYIFHGIYTICQNPPYAPPISRTDMPISGVPQHPHVVYTLYLLRNNLEKPGERISMKRNNMRGVMDALECSIS